MSTFWMEVLLAAGLIVVVAGSLPALMSLRERRPASNMSAPDLRADLLHFQAALSEEERVVRRLSPALPDASLKGHLVQHVNEGKALFERVKQATRLAS